MKNKTPNNFQSGIHTTNFWDEFLAKPICNSHIADFGRDKEKLNGLWNYGIDQYDTCLRNRWFAEHTHDADGRALPQDCSFDSWETIPVPSCWNMQSERLFLYEGSVVYTRKFTYKQRRPDLGERVFLKFGGANYRAVIFVNKQYMGVHLGGSTPFYVEVTDVLQGENRVLVVVNNTRRSESVPMENTDWFNYGGLYRDVELLRLPKTFIRSLKIGFSQGEIFADIKTDGAEKNATAILRIPELEINTKFEITAGAGRVTLPAKPVLWDIGEPKLYDVAVECGEDVLHERVGFREICVRGGEILLNGRSIFLKGISAHEDSVKNGKSVTADEIRENYALAKEMGCNFMRLAHYPHAEVAARIADEVGLLLWEEIPVYWAIEFENPDTYCDAENQLVELITRDINRASVIIWSIGNENTDTDERLDFMSRLADKARSLDNTRLISAACLSDTVNLQINDRLIDKIDIIGINEYYGWYDPDFTKLPKIFANSKLTKPVVISEFGADARAGEHGTRDDMYSEEFQLDVYEKQLDMLSKIDCVKGISPWIFFDFRCPRRLHYLQGYYNLKGLLSADKGHRKLAYYVVQGFYLGMNEE
ncbi:MAG: glycoside hydrolase family 2 [Defluviitaleaceae bacterium]|nr:glycoside hydrolase family 2 [Defluviitaleaceae bacterium]